MKNLKAAGKRIAKGKMCCSICTKSMLLSRRINYSQMCSEIDFCVYRILKEHEVTFKL
jgi:hypothetical protein